MSSVNQQQPQPQQPPQPGRRGVSAAASMRNTAAALAATLTSATATAAPTAANGAGSSAGGPQNLSAAELTARVAAIPFAPTYYPTAAQFADPLAFVRAIQPEAAAYGICKIVPPPQWRPSLNADPDAFSFQTKNQDLSALQTRDDNDAAALRAQLARLREANMQRVLSLLAALETAASRRWRFQRAFLDAHGALSLARVSAAGIAIGWGWREQLVAVRSGRVYAARARTATAALWSPRSYDAHPARIRLAALLVRAPRALAAHFLEATPVDVFYLRCAVIRQFGGGDVRPGPGENTIEFEGGDC